MGVWESVLGCGGRCGKVLGKVWRKYKGGVAKCVGGVGGGVVFGGVGGDVEKVRGRCGEKCRGCGEVCWGCRKVFGSCGEVCWGCGEMCWGVDGSVGKCWGRFGKVWGV